MKLVASTTLTVLSSLLLGFYALVWLFSWTPLTGSIDSRIVLIHAIGIAGTLLAVMALRELRRERAEAARLKAENEDFV
ncbi:MAG: hypothetical protein QM612_02360 [Thermomonas sp.]|uniref:hypothetical protein n=1 Tax=Thermomonas sp. TaxID=1971895 RepID=UPI0039E256F3